jgi:hypothetical protein
MIQRDKENGAAVGVDEPVAANLLSFGSVHSWLPFEQKVWRHNEIDGAWERRTTFGPYNGYSRRVLDDPGVVTYVGSVGVVRADASSRRARASRRSMRSPDG